MSRSNHDRAKRYVDVCTGAATDNLSRGGTVFAIGETLYSYGTHFPLAEYVRPSRGEPFFLLNGDRYSATTSQHQSMIRRMVSNHRAIILPFTALREAGIDRQTIRPIEIRPDRVDEWTELVTTDALDVVTAVSQGFKVGSGGGIVYRTLDAAMAAADEGRYPQAVFEEIVWPGTDGCRATLVHRGHVWAVDGGRWEDYSPPKMNGPYGRDGSGLERHDDGWHVRRYRHWLGDSVFTAEVSTRRTREISPDDPARPGEMLGTHHKRDGTSAAIASRTVKRRRAFLSSFDYNERNPLYFLSELPRKRRPSSVEDAVNMLAPAAVHAAIAQGRDVRRQGDIFAIPTAMATADVIARGGEIVKRARIHGTDHTASEIAVCRGGVTYGRGCLYHDVPAWRGRDHARIKLADGKVWHLMIRNTVPRA